MSKLKQSNQTKYLITCPRDKNGGVYYFAKTIIPFFPSSPITLYRGSSQRSGIAFSILSLMKTIFDSLLICLINKPDIAIINSSLSRECLIRDGLLIRLFAFMRVKPVLLIHGFQEQALVYKRLISFTYFKAVLIVVSAQSFSGQLNKLGYRQRIITQYNPVNQKLIQQLIEKPLSSTLEKFLFLGRVEVEKGIFIVLDFFAEYKKGNPAAELYVVGQGSALPEAKRFVHDNQISDVSFHGLLPSRDKEKALWESDVLMLPTNHKEGLPIAVVEAMAAGLIVMTRPVGGLVDLYKHVNFGVLTESLDPHDYVSLIQEINDSGKALEIKTRNREFAQKHFHPRRIVEELMREIENEQ